MYKILFRLARPARKAGGDRYEADILEGEGKPFVIYIPQGISRAGEGRVIAEAIEVTFDPK